MKNPFFLLQKSTFGHFLIVFAIFFFIWNGTLLKPNVTQAQGLEQALAASKGNPHIRSAMAVQQRHSARLMSIPGVVGHGIGLSSDGKPIIKIFVMRAGISRIPSGLDGIPTKVEVTGMIVAYTDPTQRVRPVPIGVSTGHPDITAGTIGARVIDGTGNVYALSNNHVYANSNDASIGDYVIQPGISDGGIYPYDDEGYPGDLVDVIIRSPSDLADVVGTLYDFEEIYFDGNNTIDAAIAEISPDVDLLCSTPSDDGYGTPSSTPKVAEIKLRVQKYGRTTGLTSGKVDEINAQIEVCYECGDYLCSWCNKSAIFVNQIGITPGSFSAGGDSGSLIVTKDKNRNPIGLLFAGSSTRTFANPIGPVLENFGVTVDDCSGACNDSDGDGFCPQDGDCDDTDFYVNPGVTEVCDDGVDNNCDDLADCADPDCDDYSACNSPCLDIGERCTSDSDCCSGDCRGKCR